MDWLHETELGDELAVWDEGRHVHVRVNGSIAVLTIREAGRLRYALARAASAAGYNRERRR
jgi:hypothetical protein